MIISKLLLLYIINFKFKFIQNRRKIIKKLNAKVLELVFIIQSQYHYCNIIKRKYKNKDKNFKVSNIISHNSICLPIGQHLNNTDIKIILKIIKKVFISYEK